MNQTDAARRLNVSLRTLQRLTRAGKLSVEYVKGSGRPKPTYCADEVEALRVDYTKRLTFQKERGSVDSPVISFRLPGWYVEKLQSAGEKFGQSANEHARHLVIASLEEQSGFITSELQGVRESIRLLTADLASTALVLLIQSGQITSEQDARNWVEANLHGANVQFEEG